MTTNTRLAHDDARQDASEAAIETKSARPAGGVAAPAIRRPADPVETIAREVEAQGREIRSMSQKLGSTEARNRLAERKQRTVKEFRDTVDERDRLAAKGRRDVVVDEKVHRINVAVTKAEDDEKALLRRENADLKKKLARPHGPTLGGLPQGRKSLDAAQAYARKCTLDYLRTGTEVFGGEHLRVIQAKASIVASNPDGGFLVQPEYETGPIERALSEASDMRRFATVRTISAASYKMPYNKGGITSGWVGETEARPETSTPQLAELEFPTMELYAMPAASQTMLDDAMMDMEAWLGEEVNIKFAESESAAFVGGSGVRQPAGFIGATTKVANASWEFGKIGFVITGDATGFPASNAGDKLLDLTYALKAGYRSGASFMLNRTSLAEVRKIKDGNGNWIWQPSAAAGEPSSLLGYPVAEVEDMPAFGANAFPIGFGDFKRGYIIVDRAGVRVLRDPYSSKPYVLFYTTKRVGGGVKDYDAIKLLKCAAT